MGDKLRNFLRSQYGPGKRWRNITTFSMAAGNNAELIPRMEQTGTGRVDSLRKVAKATGEPLLNLMQWADLLESGEVPPMEKRKLSDDEWKVALSYRGLSEQARRIVWQQIEGLRQLPGSLG